VKNRLRLHIFFWAAYILHETALEYAWINSYFAKNSVWEITWMAFCVTLMFIPLKMIMAYFIMWFVIDQGLSKGKPIVGRVLLCLPLLFGIIVLYRMLLVYYVVPIFLHNPWKDLNVFDIRRILMGFLDIGFAGACAVAMKLLRMNWLSRVREKKLLQEKLETELKFLRTQTNPHFLFNTLNNIYALARKKSDDTADVVMKLSKLLRFMLYESRKERIPLSTEIRMIEDYIELEKIRYNERLTIRLEKDIDDCGHLIAPLLLLPFIENAFKHGASETRFDSYIHIRVELKGGQLKFCIENSKEESGDTTVTDNIGLSNVRRQLELMYQEHTLQVDNQKDRFAVHLTINLNNDATLSLSYH
jgi:two-component system, LytTR family, sensor kinase